MKKEKIELGNFEVKSTVLRISDPCYNENVWCAGTVSNVLPGLWKARVTKIDLEDGWGNRCRKIVAVHTDFSKTDFMVEQLPIDVGVDSGQAGIFDDQLYQVDYDEDYIEKGQVEYEQKSDLWRAKENLPLYRDMLEMSRITCTDQLPFWEQRVKEAEEILSRGEAFDYSEATKTRDWYEICCDKTLSNIGAGVIRGGVVSSSGYGDGSYRAFAAYNKEKQVVGVKILF